MHPRRGAPVGQTLYKGLPYYVGGLFDQRYFLGHAFAIRIRALL